MSEIHSMVLHVHCYVSLAWYNEKLTVDPTSIHNSTVVWFLQGIKKCACTFYWVNHHNYNYMHNGTGIMTWKLDYSNYNQNMKEFNDLWSYSSYYDDYERVLMMKWWVKLKSRIMKKVITKTSCNNWSSNDVTFRWISTIHIKSIIIWL